MTIARPRPGPWRRLLCWIGAHEGRIRFATFYCDHCDFSQGLTLHE